MSLPRSRHRFATLFACLSLAALAACSSGLLGKKAQGNWQGTALQKNADGGQDEYPITIIITDDEHIVIDYPTLECSSTLIRLPASDGFAEYMEEVTEDPQARCLTGGLVTLSVLEEDSTKLSWRWKMRNPDQVLTYATSTLSRVPPSEPKDIAYFREQAKKEE
ncbi:MAG: hypothetical protein K2Q01_05840 [Rickettsiales bacterium]|nr:hypothetical protein [Rickettsiales bacterium]